MEKSYLQENNYLACNSPEEPITWVRNAAERPRKCKLVMRWLFAPEFKIINSGAEERGEEKLSCFICPSITSGYCNHLTLAAVPLALVQDSKHYLRKPSFSQINSYPFKRNPCTQHAHTHAHTTHTHTHNNLYLSKGNCSVYALKRRGGGNFIYKSTDQNAKLVILNSHI